MQKRSTILTLLTIPVGIIILVLTQLVAGFAYTIPVPDWGTSLLFTLIYITLAWLAVRIYSAKILKVSLQECYIRKPHHYLRWLICAFLLPLLVSLALLCIKGDLTVNTMSMTQKYTIMLSSIFTVGFGAGIGEEMIFRGLIMSTIERKWGKKAALLIPSVLFGILHVFNGKLGCMDFLFLIISGSFVGIMFSLIVYDSGSIFASATVHGIWNIIIIGHILDIDTAYNAQAIISYRLQSHSMLLTGGKFGVESSLFATAGYIIVIAITLLHSGLLHRRDT
ncbi:CPBP family intramembrane glutamic endopeptidase [Sediminispirochaeta smaragdinae]|uniref:Abortive infection protein n=1 Tax=Sediminispirochaeta smaragdinae (strain DSM 11293 / JCM 15392 / SEBR 4228) TaxID=573413 RepID=E1R350_SEDSS|nr:type II CAAX endopeptidase family protein [Sediminispirochaeta smaragdinae]ADK81236.1 Abortive infection protein [Sediminispirochaeta smaragdinae DSM 11293]